MNKTEYYKMMYSSAIYNGISNKIDFAIKYSNSDERKELQYMVERYCKEEVVSGLYLRKELEKYNKIAEEKFDKLNKSEVD